MAKYPHLWSQNLSYPAQLDRQLLGTLWPGGGFVGGIVTPVANTMQISIAPGTAAVPLQAGQGSALCHWDAPELVTLDAAPPSGQSRLDAIVCQVRDNAIDSGPNNDFVFTAIKGTPSSGTPDVAAIPPNAVYFWAIQVTGGAANLNGAGSWDRRLSLGPYRRQYSRGYNVPGGSIQGVCPTSTPPYFMTSANEQSMTFLLPCLVSVIVKVDCPGDDWLQVTSQSTDQAFRAIMNWGGGYNVTGVFSGYVAPDETVSVLSVVGAAGMHNSYMNLTITPCVPGIRQAQTGGPTTCPGDDEIPDAEFWQAQLKESEEQ